MDTSNEIVKIVQVRGTRIGEKSDQRNTDNRTNY